MSGFHISICHDDIRVNVQHIWMLIAPCHTIETIPMIIIILIILTEHDVASETQVENVKRVLAQWKWMNVVTKLKTSVTWMNAFDCQLSYVYEKTVFCRNYAIRNNFQLFENRLCGIVPLRKCSTSKQHCASPSATAIRPEDIATNFIHIWMCNVSIY